MIIKYKTTKEVIDKLTFIKEKYNSNKEVEIDIDINPIKL